ncbi:MAG: hypothetical protein ACTFAL_08115 [Candidatus Electronema sp. V4]|uniref:hypothetical protein n=1 Tax=Candidatus Electronema sp. V4 TaxID=3454756 RepID=UPI0040555C4F
MGWGYYSVDDRAARAASVGYDTKSAREIFTQRNINNAMDPHGIVKRESRDSAEHPDSVAIILALDVTGSMGSIPHHLVKDGLPKIMGRIIQSGTPDPQLLFLAVGDHECDSCPLQVGQFESSDELLDKWLTSVYLEGGGGGNAGESYLLAWYFAGFHTSIDCVEKRKQKGFLFTIGDEPTLRDVPGAALKKLMGGGQYDSYISADALLDKARQMYHVFHLHIRETGAGSMQATVDGWKQLMGDNLIALDHHEEVSRVIPELIAATLRKDAAGKTAAAPAGPLPQTEVIL